MGELKVASSLRNGEEEGEFFCLIQKTLEKIGENGVDIDDIMDNVIFVFHTKPAITRGTESRSVIASFNLSSLKKDIEKNGKNFGERAMDIIAHECAHYVKDHYKPEIFLKKGPSKCDEEADDLIVEWGFNRAYTK